MSIAQTTFESLTIAVDQLPWLAAIWFCFLGGCIGSFMNVVVYRVPAGMSLVHPGSCCPRCRHAIRARDNLPVLGWLLLKGRCRDCQAPISARYPIVEGTVAAAFLVFWWVDVWQLHDRIVSPNVRLGLFGMHAILFSTLLCAALIDVDGHSVPALVFLPCIVAFTVCNWATPQTARLLQGDQAWSHPWMGGLLGALIGLLADPGMRQRSERLNRIVAAALTGAILSAMAIALIAILASLTNCFSKLVAGDRRSIWLFSRCPLA